MGIWVLLITFIISAPYVSAQHVSQEACTDTDIRETNPKIKNDPKLYEHFSKPRNQDSIGWCYAFAAADIVSAEVGVPISAMHVSTNYNELFDKSFLHRTFKRINNKFRPPTSEDEYFPIEEGGYAEFAIRSMSKKKFCSEEDFPFDQSYSKQTLSMIWKLEEAKKYIAETEATEEVACQLVNFNLGIGGLQTMDIAPITKILTEKSINETLQKVAEIKCKENPIEVPKLNIKTIYNPRTKLGVNRYFSHVNKSLESGKPIYISYHSADFRESEGEDHASIVTARRWKNDRCEYKVRNSWGKTCAVYKKDIDCNLAEGSFWISDEQFRKSVKSIHYVQK